MQIKKGIEILCEATGCAAQKPLCTETSECSACIAKEIILGMQDPSVVVKKSELGNWLGARNTLV